MKTALVTGAARGIGLATTKQFLSKDWHVVMVDRDEEALTAEAAQLRDVTAVTCDVSLPDQVAGVAKRFDRVNALVNNAGVADFGPIEETSFSRWRTVMETNLDGVFMMTQALTPALT
ncbi:MAG: SDR family NAD(P)-dependent oxidoreductase, partial [Pseudomonadota bacterium]